MTDNPIFQEIDEDLERQKLEALWKRYGGLVIGVAIIIIVSTGTYTAWQSWRTKQEQQETGDLITILEDTSADTTKQIAALQAFADKYHGETQGALAGLQAAAIAAKSGDAKKAAALYDGVAGDSKADPALRQLADLLSVQTQMDDGDPVSLQQRLQPLLADNAPWRYSAMEDAAFLALKAGDKPKAKQIFTELSQDAAAPQGIAARANDMLRFIGE